MTPQKQLFRHRPAEGVIGDCWRTCFACLLDLPVEAVPHFLEDCWEDYVTAAAKAKSWLATQGFTWVEFAFQAELGDVLASVKVNNSGVYYLLGGNSRNGVGHQVIGCDDQIVWDPALDDSGIVAPMSDGHYWVGFLVPLSMTRAAP
nr:hypothetical protein [uncultured Roseateles sp.]